MKAGRRRTEVDVMRLPFKGNSMVVYVVKEGIDNADLLRDLATLPPGTIVREEREARHAPSKWWAWGLWAEYTNEQMHDGTRKPWYLGRAFWRFEMDSTVCVVIPMHLAVNIVRNLWIWLRRAHYADAIERAYQKGRGELQAVRNESFDRGWRVGAERKTRVGLDD